MNHKTYHVFFWTTMFLAAAAGSARLGAQEFSQPVAPVREVADEYFGTRVVDPYRWMEGPRSEELSEWMKLQNNYTRNYLDRSPLRQKFARELEAQSLSVTSVSGVRRVGDRYFYFKLAPGDADRKIFVRDVSGGEERLLVDPQKISAEAGRRFSLLSFSPSPDGRFVAFLTAAGGAELGEIRVVETESGKMLPDKIDRARWEAGAWLPEEAGGFLYVRFAEPGAEDAPATERFHKRKVYLHRIGEAAGKDEAVFGFGVTAGLEVDPKMLPFPVIPPGSKYAFIVLNSGVSPNSELFFAPVETLTGKQIPWRRAAGLQDEVRDFAVRGDDLYVLTYRNAPRFKVVKTGLQSPDLARAETVVETSEAVTKDLVAAIDALYVQQMDGGIGRILRVDFQTGKTERLAPPHDGTISELHADPRQPGVIFAMDSWVRPKTVFAYEAGYGEFTDTKLQPPLPLDVSGFESRQVKVRSHDGVMVPLSVIHKKGLKLDGRNVVGLTGYGAYGISSEPRFLLPFLPFLEAGGVVAFAHVRGGGEYGDEWHRAGFKGTKPNTWKDFIACAEYLIEQKYTEPRLLVGHGASAGGILIGNALAERPDLFGAAIIMVGLNNMLRYETTANGVPNIPEYGSVKTEQGFNDLLAMDAYQKIKPGVKYPAVLLTHGINDPRVEPWLSAKMAARLQASTASGRPVLLRIDYDAGHGIGNSRRQVIEEFADIFTFIFEQLGEHSPDRPPVSGKGQF